MKAELLHDLEKAHDKCVIWQGEVPTFDLVTFESGEMLDAIAGTPFRKFESVPQRKESKRKQNDSMSFDPYLDTLFDYPSIIKRTLCSPLDAIKYFNWHLTVQVPYCRFDCWHCYNPKGVCQTGSNIGKVEGDIKAYTVQQILDQFVQFHREAESRGERYNVLRVSGGEPFLAPELIAGLLEEISNNPNPHYPKLIWTETNLSSWAATSGGESLVSKADAVYYEKTKKRLTDILRTHADRIVVHPCFHGLSDENLARCTGMKPGLLQFKDLINGFRVLHGLQLHLYPTIISEASDPDHVDDLFNELYAIDQRYPLKLALIPLDYYPPTQERCKDRVEEAGVYNRFACQQRWRTLLKRYYGVDYSQVPRPFVEGMTSFPKATDPASASGAKAASQPAAVYEPLLILLKSHLRPEYRQELMTLLASPEGTRIRESYDVKHLAPSLFGRLDVETETFCKLCPKVLVAYANKQQSSFTCIPLREARLVRIDKTQSLVSFEMILGPYMLPQAEGAAAGTADEGKACVNALGQRMTEYFGVAHTLGKAGKSAWVLLGEQTLLKSREDGLSFRPLAKGEGNGWGTVVNLLATHDGARTFFGERNIFVRLQPHPNQPAVDDKKLRDEQAIVSLPHAVQLTEGDKAAYRLSFYIPQFEKYQSEQQRDELKAARTLRITSSTPSLVIEGYQPRPLPKYGDFDFVIRCSKLENDIPAQVVIEAGDQSCYCPRILLEFQLKKDGPSAC